MSKLGYCFFFLKNWNCGLEAAALQHAMRCTFAKSDVATRPDNGENQATIAAAASYRAAAEQAVRQWWKTIRTTGGVGMNRLYQQSFVGTPIDSFTQMAWATTRRLGCAVARCNGRYNVVCRYSERRKDLSARSTMFAVPIRHDLRGQFVQMELTSANWAGVTTVTKPWYLRMNVYFHSLSSQQSLENRLINQFLRGAHKNKTK
ncbi:hypothetical protein Y032_0275g1031 [Ancylostoma ceylanicum]|uniref:SCP domain-containing protein n=2 Tax=Ancylostoma ceylanicum TaxID=53326 RepID=A0A016S7H6_9BILA|nr:hypothetical protein Y032_0275g1031 [Ancylostoma ceylanicum]